MSNQGQNGGNGNTPTGQQTTQNTSSASSSSSSFSIPFIPATAAAGGITITQPPQQSTSFFKIAPSQPITFAWNFTDLIVTPTHLTVSAVCGANGRTYPVGPTDGIIPGTATEVVWDLYAYQTNNPGQPLAVATYTLNIWDDRGPGAPRRGGFLQQNSALQFALYSPAPYTAISDGWKCPTCNSAASIASHPAFISVVVTFFIIFFSGFHLLRNSARN